MTVRELIEQLSDLDQDATIRVATQPSYPMEASLIGPLAHGNDVWLAIGENRSHGVPANIHDHAQWYAESL